MKTRILLALIGLISLNLYAQDDTSQSISSEKEFKTIFSSTGEIKISGFGGPMMSFGTIDGYFAHMMGGGGGVLINNFFVGGYGMGLTNPIPYRDYASETNITEPSEEFNLEFGHGGFWTGFIIAPNSPVHLSISSQFGWGSIDRSYVNDDNEDDKPFNPDDVFVVTPIVELELNFSQFFKIGLGASTSLVQFTDASFTYDMNDFLNPNVFLSFKFGWFD